MTIVLEAALVIFSLATPIWWFTRSDHASASANNWAVWQKNVARLIEADGGFPPCGTLTVVDAIQDACDSSVQKMQGDKSVAIERAAKQVTFSCEATKTGYNVSWHLQDNPKADLECGDPGGNLISRGPGFEFTKDGRIRSFTFHSADGVFQRVPYRNCRTKANLAKSITPPPSDVDDFLFKLGRVDNDPDDYATANEMCFIYDSSPLWASLRKRYAK